MTFENFSTSSPCKCHIPQAPYFFSVDPPLLDPNPPQMANNFSFHYNFWWITFLQAELTPSLLHPLHSTIPSALSHPILTMAKAPLKSYRHYVLLSSCLNCYINAVYPPPHASLSLTHSITNERLSALSVSRLRPPPPAVPSYFMSPESH